MMIESFLSGHCQTIEIFTKYQSVEACTSISALWSLPNLIDINWNQDLNISQLEHVPVHRHSYLHSNFNPKFGHEKEVLGTQK